MDYKQATVILPTLNEENNVGKLVGALKKGYPGIRVLVVDDGSSDATVRIARECGAQVLDRRGERIKGITASVLEGLERTGTEYFIVMDSDLQHPPQKVGEIIRKLEADSGLVVACRSSVPGWALQRRLISLGAEILGRMRLAIFANPSPKDILSGFFGGKTETVKKSINKNPGRFVPQGYKILFDLLKGIEKNEFSISEIPYVFEMRRGGSSKIKEKHALYFLCSILK